MTKTYSRRDTRSRPNRVKQFVSFRQGRINRRKEWRKQLRIRTNLEKRLFGQLNRVFRGFLNRILYVYEQTGFYDRDIGQQQLAEEMLAVIYANYRRIFRTMFAMNEEKYQLSQKQQVTEDSDAFVFGRTAEIDALVDGYFNGRQLVLQGISTRLANRIDTLIQNGILEGLTKAQIAKKISDSFLPISRTRAALIARTEAHNAASVASNAYFMDAQDYYGLTMKKVWTSTRDARTRETHLIADGQERDMNDPFRVGGQLMMYAGDSAGGAAEVVNCRCVILYADKEDDFF